jgi:hypothetical protein
MQRWLKMLNIYRDDLAKFKVDLSKGMDIIKHGRSGAEKMRTIFSEDMGATVNWVSGVVYCRTGGVNGCVYWC